MIDNMDDMDTMPDDNVEDTDTPEDNPEDDNNLVVGVTGYSQQEFDEGEAEDALNNILDDIEDEYLASGEFENITIVSGLTDMGIPKIAYEIADERDYKTIGIAPDEAENEDLYDVDEIIWVGKNYGDESQTFIDHIDVLVRIGGGDQAMQEVQMADDEDIPVYEYDL